MASPKLTLYVDVVSPFGYLAYYVTRHSPIFRTCEITYIPIYLGGLLRACNNRPPLEIKNKDKWIGAERLRWAKLFKIPITPTIPANFPPQTLHVERALAALELSSSSLVPAALDALFHRFWVDGDPDIGKPETFGPVLERALGKEVAEMAVRESSGDPAKKRLAENTERAFESGAFGLPWWECVNAKGEREGYWGFDHLRQVVRFLGLLEEGEPVEGMKIML